MSKKIAIVIGFIAGILAVVLAVTPLFNLAITPIVVAFLSLSIILFLSKKQHTKTKTIQYIFLLVTISLSLTLYKSVLSKKEIDNTEQPEQLNDENLENSKEIPEDSEIEENF